jgi:hypothetical protein
VTEDPPGGDVAGAPACLGGHGLGTPTTGRVLIGAERQKAIDDFIHWLSHPDLHGGGRDFTKAPIAKKRFGKRGGNNRGTWYE